MIRPSSPLPHVAEGIRVFSRMHRAVLEQRTSRQLTGTSVALHAHRRCSRSPLRCRQPAAALVWLMLAAAPGHAWIGDLRASHSHGQTVLRFRIGNIPLQSDLVNANRLLGMRNRSPRIRYRVYRSAQPVTHVHGITPLHELRALDAWNHREYGIRPRDRDKARRYVLPDGPLARDELFYVHSPSESGTFYYAITEVVDDVESQALTEQNHLQTAIQESTGLAPPVLQYQERISEFHGIQNVEVSHYVRFEQAPNTTLSFHPVDYLIAFPARRMEPAPVGLYLHAWGGTKRFGYGPWINAEQGSVLVASNQDPYDWWTGYRSDWQREESGGAHVEAFSQRRLMAFVRWAAEMYPLDLTRLHVVGSSMGGTGAALLPLLDKNIGFVRSDVAVFRPKRAKQFRSSFARVWGPNHAPLPMSDADNAWHHFDLVRAIESEPDASWPLFIVGSGKNDEKMDWRSTVQLVKTLQTTKQPHVFRWGQNGHSPVSLLPGGENDRILDLGAGDSLPAFSASTCDDNIGTGSRQRNGFDGDDQGQINLYLMWKDTIDSADRWQTTLYVHEKSKKKRCTVWVTPRRLAHLRKAERYRVDWKEETWLVTPDEAGRISLRLEMDQVPRDLVLHPASRSE